MTDAEQSGAVEAVEGQLAAEIDRSKSAPADRETAGPFDFTEVPAMRPYVDLGGIKVAPREGLQMRLEVDERAKRVVAATLGYAESQLQLQAFAAPKTTGLWHQTRAELAAQLTQQGAKVLELEGALGTDLLVTTPAVAGQNGPREIRFIGVDGPRWMLRGLIMGKGASDLESYDQLIELFRETVVIRGDQPLPPGEMLALKVPAGAQAGATETQA
ncbi:DUF3710 domain-containing protein [Leucobacter sp. cx-328]|uniref:DUF3710 domain-containing protein n=1 Tax=unclassified Leucobacter TaxID=2621730 RepID=UPI00165E5718|nr:MULTISPECIES: DUF3710 domain-containing protein [unclassified Leucobacter]MBC9945162.1 DUF3710 domain-containing protein [Leucobacter sp. cx-328]